MTSIIIPVRNQRAYTRLCLRSIRTYTRPPYEVIAVDNRSSDGTAAYLEKLSGVRLLRNPVNRGFAGAVNQGLEAARGEYIVLLNNDTLVSHRWLDQLLAVLHDERNGLTGPLSNRVIPEQKIKVTLTKPEEIHSFCRRFNRTDPSKWRAVPRLSGFCLAFRARLIREIGRLDERFGLGTYEDDDFSHRARLAGYRCIVAGDTYVHHFGSRSFRRKGQKEFYKILRQNRRYFVLKWDRPPVDGKDSS
ncbi:glycosyltransferase family 2 protein [Paludifilum halophilum]|nr:glycosyltransferase family 2 protein [Paludifilum halophilum]